VTLTYFNFIKQIVVKMSREDKTGVIVLLRGGKNAVQTNLQDLVTVTVAWKHLKDNR